MLTGKNVVLGVSGGIACYKSATLCSLLVKQHCNVHVIMTKNATEFISPLTFEALSGNPVAVDTFSRTCSFEIEHVSIANQADLVIVAPATANILAKLANGLADDMLTTTILACKCPKIAAPSMNTNMLENSITQINLQKLISFGWEILESATGRLACGSYGKGKMPEPEDLLESILHTLSHPKDMEGLNVLVTAGPTRESLDPVRFLTNHSSGKMGYAIAKAASARGACVKLITGPTNIKSPAYIHTTQIVTAKEMFDKVTSVSTQMDIIIKAAAVADYRPVNIAENKIKKINSDSDIFLQLEHTDDILAYLGSHKKPGQLLCGFSMETENLLENSRTKLLKKNLDLVAANSLLEEGAGFGIDTNVITLITKEEETSLPLMSKDSAANALLDKLLTLRKGKKEDIYDDTYC